MIVTSLFFTSSFKMIKHKLSCCKKISLNAEEAVFPCCYHQSLPCEPIHSDTYLCLSHSLLLIRERWREGEPRWCLWCSSGSLQNPCFLHQNNSSLCGNLLSQSIRCSDMDMKYHLELHSCRWGCWFSVVFSWAQRCWSLWEIHHQI